MQRVGYFWSSPRTRAFAIAALLLAHLVWILLGRTPGNRFRHAMDILQRPGLKVSNLWYHWRTARQMHVKDAAILQGELQHLRSRVQALETERQANGPRIAESEEALRLLGVRRLLPLEFKSARVLANLRRAPYGGLVVDQGQDAGLMPDQGVIVPEGVVGRIWDVGSHQASILPLDAYNASTAVMLARSRATGILQGTGPGRAEIRYISRQEVVQAGEPVYTSGLDRVFPRGLLVGWVVGTKPLDNELQVDVSLAAPLDRVGLVLILPPSPRLEIAPPAPPAKAKGGKG